MERRLRKSRPLKIGDYWITSDEDGNPTVVTAHLRDDNLTMKELSSDIMESHDYDSIPQSTEYYTSGHSTSNTLDIEPRGWRSDVQRGETSSGLRHRVHNNDTDPTLYHANERLHAYVSEMTAPEMRDGRYGDAISMHTRGTPTNSVTSEPSLISTDTEADTEASWVRPSSEATTEWEVPTPSDTESQDSIQHYQFENRPIFDRMLS